MIKNLFGKIKTFFSENPQTTKFIGVIALLLAIPLTTIVALTTQSLKQRASGPSAIILSDQSGKVLSSADSTTNRNIFIDIDLTKTGFVVPNESKSVLGVSTIISQSLTTSPSTTYSKDSVYALKINRPIYALTLNADINIKSKKSLARIILVDKNKKEYLVYEAYPMLGNLGAFSANSVCEETCVLNAVIPTSLKIQLVDATIRIKSIAFSDSIKKLSSDVQKVGIQSFSRSLNVKQKSQKVKQINDIIKKNGLKWIAGETKISKMSYEQKKKMFTNPNGTKVDKLPNLQGFEYYAGGVFEPLPTTPKKTTFPASPKIASTTLSDLPTRWDWRNVHGENWLTSVRDQGGVGTCFTHAIVGTLEAQINLYYNQHLDVDLSEQQLVDCGDIGNVSELPYAMGSGAYAEECILKEDCYDTLYCPISHHGIADEKCDPYVERFDFSSSSCNSKYICSDFQQRSWSNSDFYTYKYISNYGTKNCSKEYMHFTEADLKKFLINKGPLSSGVPGHAMVLVGYDTDDITKETIWIFKNSWGINGTADQGYTKAKVSLEDIGYAVVPLGPFIPPTDKKYWPKEFDGTIKCVDKDNDNYCNWGISEQMPSTCPKTCKPQKDCDDSNPNITQVCKNTPLWTPTVTSTPVPSCRLKGDVNNDRKINKDDITKVERIILGIEPAIAVADVDGDGSINVGDITKIERYISELDPLVCAILGPNILKAVYIENKDADGSINGSKLLKIMVKNSSDISRIAWKLNELLSVQNRALRTIQVTLIGDNSTEVISNTVNLIKSDGPIDHSPILNPIGNKTTNVDTYIEFTISASDPDGDTLTYSASNLPQGATFDPMTHIFSWRTLDEDKFSSETASFNILFQVSDGELTDSENVTINIHKQNQAPTLYSIGNKTAYVGQTITFPILASDPDGDTLRYFVSASPPTVIPGNSGSALPEGAKINQETHTFSWTPTNTNINPVYLRFEITDGKKNDYDDIVISVLNTSPISTLTLTPIPTSTTAPTPSLTSTLTPTPQCMRGDANSDGTINMGDAVKVDRIILGLDPKTDGADANGDGIINKDDITKIQRIILGIEKSLPCNVIPTLAP